MFDIQIPTHLENVLINIPTHSSFMIRVNVERHINSYVFIKLYKHIKINSTFIIIETGKLGSTGKQIVKSSVNYHKTILEYERLVSDYTMRYKYRKIHNIKSPMSRSHSTLNIKANIHSVICEAYKYSYEYMIKNISGTIDYSFIFDNTDTEIINEAYNILDKLKTLMESKDSLIESKEKIFVELSNDFYSIIPSTQLSIIDNADTLHHCINLTNYIETYIGSFYITIVPPYRYSIQKIDSDDINYNMINKYFNNSVKTIKEIYKVVDNTAFIFNPNKINNIQLLWHGTKNEFLYSILNAGLKLPNKEGCMFGKGIYFANHIKKSLSYCDKYILLCKVALGTCNDLITSLPKAHETIPNVLYKSVHGIGCSTPDTLKQEYYTDGKIIVPSNDLINRQVKYHLNYDEYVIYDLNQVQIEFLILL